MDLFEKFDTGFILSLFSTILTLLFGIGGIWLGLKALPLKNSGILRTPIFDYKGDGIIYFGNSIIKTKNGGGLVVVDHKTFQPVIKIERKLKDYILFKKDQLLVTGSFWDGKNDEIIHIDQNKWEADPSKMWNAKITNNSIEIKGSDEKHEAIFYCAMIDEKTIKIECKSRIRDLSFSATKDGLTVNDIGFKKAMVFDATEHTSVIFRIGGPQSPISFEPDGPAFYVKGFDPTLNREGIGLFTAILAAPKKEIIDWKNRVIVLPDVEFLDLIKSAYIIGELPNENKTIWNTVVFNIEYNNKKFIEIIKGLSQFLGVAYEEARENNPEIMAWALNCEVELAGINGDIKTLKKMAEIKDGDKVIRKNLVPHRFQGFEQ